MTTRSTRTTARLVLLGLLGLAVWGLMPTSRAPAPRLPPPGRGDAVLYESVVQRVRAGAGYYSALGTDLRRLHYPTTKIFNWRTPAHLELVAVLSIPVARMLLRALTIAGAILLPLAMTREPLAPRIIGFIALLGALATAAKPQAVLAGEVWSGVLIALSLCACYLGAWKTAALAGVAALFVRELAAPYCVVCALVSLKERRRGASVIWLVAGLAYAAYFATHAAQVQAHQQPGDLSQDEPWMRWNGIAFISATVGVNGWLNAAPHWVTVLYIVLALAGTASPRLPAQAKVSLWAYGVLFSFAGQPFNFYWGYVTAPLWAVAAAHGGEGLMGLVERARARPRQTSENRQSLS